ncbi:hypothetical protein [uncultured Hymenobacter sp.]|uniref:hypothetical protein n=1 Tax=uncultured Hymenobacter sp. TaxID=170016 RepID=UPI0035CA9E81
MSRTEQLIQEISQLTDREAQAVYEALAQRLAPQNRVAQLLAQVSGSGAGVWGLDAQQYVTEIRENDRF